jgi:hypothetical protein
VIPEIANRSVSGGVSLIHIFDWLWPSESCQNLKQGWN